MMFWSYFVAPGLILLSLWVTGASCRPATPHHFCDQCECYLSEDPDEPKGIMSVKAKCKEGHIEWTNPYGAIRLEINPGHHTDFKGCVVVSSKYITVKVSQETRSGLKHLETVKGVSREICLTSSSAPIMLYTELVPESNSDFIGVPSVFIDYDIEKNNPQQHFFDPLEDCRPCDEEELLRAYCSSDYVVQGQILRVNHLEEKGETNIEVAAHKVIQQSREDLFQKKPYQDGHSLQGTIVTPKKCGVQQGPGVFMLMGSVKLGRMRLKCAPFLEDWDRIRRLAEEDDSIQCSFD